MGLLTACKVKCQIRRTIDGLGYTDRHRLSPTLSPTLSFPAETSRFRVYDLVEDAPPKNFHEAAERGDVTYMVKLMERTIDFDINEQVCSRSWTPSYSSPSCFSCSNN